MPVKSGGPTPITVYARPPTRIWRPTMSGSPAKALCQYRWSSITNRMPAARDVVARQQGASDRRLDSQQREVAAGDRLGRRQADASTLAALRRRSVQGDPPRTVGCREREEQTPEPRG